MNEAPSQVKRQEAAADAALAAMMGTHSGDDQPESAVNTEANTQDAFAQAKAEPALASPTPEVEPKKEAGETVAKEDFEKLSQQLRVLQGKYNHEVPRLNDRAKELTEQNEALKDQIDAAKAASPLETDPSAYQKYLLDDEKEDMDMDLLDFQSRLAKGVAEEVASKKSKDLEGKVKTLEDLIAELNQSQEAASDAAFWAEAEAKSPGVTKANTEADPGWVAFLEKTDSVSRLPFRTIGQAAIERGDHEVVANLFTLYKEQSEGRTATPHTMTVESQIKPETTPSTTNTDTRPTGPTIKESEIKAFYRNAAGNLTEAQITAKEVEFDRAASEGRIAFGK